MQNKRVSNSKDEDDDNCRLIFTKRTLPHSQCVKVDIGENEDVHWMSIFAGPIDRKAPWEVDPDIFAALVERVASMIIDNEGKVYGLLQSPFENETRAMLRDIRSSGLISNAPRSWLGWLRFYVGGSILVEATGKHVSEWFKQYGGWMITPWFFIVSKSPLTNWKGKLRSMGRINGRLLREVDLVLFNHYDHGVEVVSRGMKPDALQAVAEELASKFQIPLKVRDVGDPLDDS